MLLLSDASKDGWGAHFQDFLTLGTWSLEERYFHINLLEVCAILLALHAFQDRLINHIVALMSKSTSEVAYVNKQGRTVSSSLYLLARQVLAWDESISMNLVGCYIPGPWNVVVDQLIRPGRLNSVSDLEDSNNGFVCARTDHKTTGVLFLSSQSNGLRGGCVLSSQGNLGSLHLSPIQSDSHGHKSTDDISVSQNDSDHSVLATSRVVSGLAESRCGLPKGDPSVAFPSSSAFVKIVSPKCPCSGSSCLELIQHALQERFFLEGCGGMHK